MKPYQSDWIDKLSVSTCKTHLSSEWRAIVTPSFYNCEKQIEIFNAMLSERARRDAILSDERRIIVWHGDGGSGKSKLCAELSSQITNRRKNGEKLALAQLDFENTDHRDLKKAMLKLCLDFKHSEKIPLPTFTAAFAELSKKDQPGIDVRDQYPYLFRHYDNDSIVNFIELANGFIKWSGQGIPECIEFIAKTAPKFVGGILDWWELRGRQQIHDFRNSNANELTKSLPQYLALDIEEAMRIDNNIQFILLLDTFEAVSPSDTSCSFTGNAQVVRGVRKLIQNASDTMVVVFGRNRIQWLDNDDALRPSIREDDCLEGFCDKTASKFLSASGIRERSIRERIIKGAQGLPQYLVLSVEQYQKTRHDGHQPKLEQFGETIDEVVENYLIHLSENEREEVLLASYLESLDQHLLDSLCAAGLTNFFRVNWERLLRHSFINVESNGRVWMRRRVKDDLQHREKKKREPYYKSVHDWISRYYAAIAFEHDKPKNINETCDDALIMTAFHRKQFDGEKLIQWFNSEKLMVYFHAERWYALSRIIQLVEEEMPPQNLASEDRARLFHSAGHILQKTEDFDDSARTFEMALIEQERIYGEPEAHTLQALADVLLELGTDWRKVESLYERALNKYKHEKHTKHVGPANCLLGLAMARAARGNQTEADNRLQEARTIYRTHVDESDPEYIKFLRKLHKIHCDWGEYKEAFQMLEEAWNLLKANGQTNTVHYAEILIEFLTYLDRHPEENRIEVSGVLSDIREICGREHRLSGRAMYFDVKLNSLSQMRQGDAQQLKYSQEILERVLGPDHTWTAEARDLLGKLKRDERYCCDF